MRLLCIYWEISSGWSGMGTGSNASKITNEATRAQGVGVSDWAGTSVAYAPFNAVGTGVTRLVPQDVERGSLVLFFHRCCTCITESSILVRGTAVSNSSSVTQILALAAQTRGIETVCATPLFNYRLKHGG